MEKLKPDYIIYKVIAFSCALFSSSQPCYWISKLELGVVDLITLKTPITQTSKLNIHANCEKHLPPNPFRKQTSAHLENPQLPFLYAFVPPFVRIQLRQTTVGSGSSFFFNTSTLQKTQNAKPHSGAGTTILWHRNAAAPLSPT
jgi:hypothetical protein